MRDEAKISSEESGSVNNYSQSLIFRKPAVRSRNGLVTANHRLAAEAGAEILAMGGNAIDAAITTSMMLGVCEPWMSGLGGCGQMLVHMQDSDNVRLFDFGTISPASLRPADFILNGEQGDNLFNWPMVTGDMNNIGARSICVPSQLAGLALAHKTLGKMPWHELLAPAINQAIKGVPVDAYGSLFIAGAARALRSNMAAAALFLDDGLPPSLAWSSDQIMYLPMTELARTISGIADEGASLFYQGEIGQKLCEDIAELGGYLKRDDLANYMAFDMPAPRYRIGDCEIATSARHTAGSSLADAIEHMQGNQLRSPAEHVTLAKVLQSTAKRYMCRSGEDVPGAEPSCTTHFNIVDRQGNMVVVTQTLLSTFGSKVLSPKTGILLNNGTLWFDPAPDQPNSIGAGKRPVSNICSVIARWPDDHGEDIKVGLGAAGGRKIMPAVAQILLRMLAGMSLEDAFHAPRIETSQLHRIVADVGLDGAILDALDNAFDMTLSQRHFYPYAFACPAGIYRHEGINYGCTETYSLWGDTVTEEMVGDYGTSK